MASMSKRPAVLSTDAPGFTPRRGKVRDVYDLGDRTLLVATDRISAFDWVMPTGVPDKGAILTRLSSWWFRRLDEPNHVLSTDFADFGSPFDQRPDVFAGRSVLCRKLSIIPIECVVRGYLSGSGWKEYRNNRSVCGVKLPEKLVESDRLPEPIFTPATKAETGHDENISFAETVSRIGESTAYELKKRSLSIYRAAAERAERAGLILADTKFEFGRTADGEILLADEVLTPDSSRYWPADSYRPGGSQPSFDKQYLRDWLESIGWDKRSPPPPLPDDVVVNTREKYLRAYERLTGESFSL
jgi:phosphoribosylaminoimidazole-succinocarboxamide synthase